MNNPKKLFWKMFAILLSITFSQLSIANPFSRFSNQFSSHASNHISDQTSNKRSKKSAISRVKGDLSIMVLGSGGPIAVNQPKDRAGPGYIIFTDGKPRILMDSGGGTYKTLAKSGVNLKDIDIILLSHLHADHTGDLTPIIKTVYFHNNLFRLQNQNPGSVDFQRLCAGRTAPIRIWGPDETALPTGTPGTAFPNGVKFFDSTKGYVDDHYSVGPTPANPMSKPGSERYLNPFVTAISEQPGCPPVENAPAGTNPVSRFAVSTSNLSSNWAVPPNTPAEVILDEDGLVITAVAVAHGTTPAVAFRIDYKGKSIVFTGDTNSRIMTPAGSALSPALIGLSNDADLLIYDTAITDTLPVTPIFRAIHTSPTDLGVVAATAGVKKLLLSHLTPVTAPAIRNDVIPSIRNSGYRGKIKVARDLKVINIR